MVVGDLREDKARAVAIGGEGEGEGGLGEREEREGKVYWGEEEDSNGERTAMFFPSGFPPFSSKIFLR